MWAWHFSACLLFFFFSFLYLVVRIRRHRKKFTFAISSPWWVFCKPTQRRAFSSWRTSVSYFCCQ